MCKSGKPMHIAWAFQIMLNVIYLKIFGNKHCTTSLGTPKIQRFSRNFLVCIVKFLGRFWQYWALTGLSLFLLCICSKLSSSFPLCTASKLSSVKWTVVPSLSWKTWVSSEPESECALSQVMWFFMGLGSTAFKTRQVFVICSTVIQNS